MAARVKICGLTRAEDAWEATHAGASAIGVILWPGSPRCVSAERAAEILAAVPPGVLKVGVFVDQPRSYVARVVRVAGLDAVQLHGRENPADYNMGVLVLKSVPVGPRFDTSTIRAMPSNVLPLLDAADHKRKGGTGLTIDWHAGARAAAVRRIVLAGGLTPLNVREAIRAVQPFAVDVSSGVEAAPGRKSVALIRAFFEAVRAETGEIVQGSWL